MIDALPFVRAAHVLRRDFLLTMQFVLLLGRQGQSTINDDRWTLYSRVNTGYKLRDRELISIHGDGPIPKLYCWEREMVKRLFSANENCN